MSNGIKFQAEMLLGFLGLHGLVTVVGGEEYRTSHNQLILITKLAVPTDEPCFSLESPFGGNFANWSLATVPAKQIDLKE
jgi:hypothetical protein